MVGNCARFMVLIALTALFVTAPFASAQAESLVRFVHVVPGAPPVDVFVDGQLTVVNLAFGEATQYIIMPPGERSVRVRQADTDSLLWEQTLLIGGNANYTLVASSSASPIFTVYRDENDLDPIAVGLARFTSIHAIADAPAIDVLLDDGRALVVSQAYNQPFGTLDIPLFTYNLVITPAGAGVEGGISNLELPVRFSGTSYKLILYGTLSSPRYMVLTAPVRPENEAGAARVRLVHAVPGAPAVDVYAGETLVAMLSEPAEGENATGFIALPAGDYVVNVRESGTQTTLLSGTLKADAGLYTTAAVISLDGELALSTYFDDLSAVNTAQPVLRLINIGPGNDSVLAVVNNAVVEIAAGDASPLISVPAAGELTVNIEVGGMALEPFTGQFYGGVFYDHLVSGSSAAALFPLPPVALAQSIASAPGAQTAVAQLPAVPELPAQLAQPVEPAPQPPVAQVEPSPAPVISPPVVLPPAPTYTGRVFNLDPDRNLQLRQYPNSQALSFGVVALGTVFIVNGREGELAEIFTSATRVPPDYVYVDPVELLQDERADLARDETWLFVTYDTPDGGQIDAWVRSDFVDVRDASGQQVPLRNLPTVPGNTPGESRNTTITSPAARQDVTTVRVVNMLPTANLNVRRLPTADSEVLARLPLNTVAEFLGVGENGEWAFIRYTAPDGGSVTGWVSTQFLAYELNGRPSKLEDLEARGLLRIVPQDTRGGTGTGVALQPAVPTVDPRRDAIIATVTLDPGANLNLRRTPDINAEVIAPILSGTQVVVSARTGDGRWLQVTYEGQEGWIAARTDTAVFVTLSFNGQRFELANVPLAPGEVDTLGAPAGD
ncbi:MAG: DUF4397 domain-containing protein [Aggregatilineales bacterium]